MQRPQPFVFQRFWLFDTSFPGLISSSWQVDSSLAEAVENFAKKATTWNRTHFRNVFAKRRRILARLNGVQRAITTSPTSFLLQLESNLHLELDQVLDQEHKLWALKSRINLAVQGDHNTSFFHLSTLVRRKRNNITAIKNRVGEWLLEKEDLANYVQRGFVDIYSTSQTSSPRLISPSSQWQAVLPNEDRDSLRCEVSMEEIKAALWSMKASKAPNLDGLHAGFFQRF